MQSTLFLITSLHRGWRSLRPGLSEQPDLRVVGETSHPDQAVRAIATLRPAAILLDTGVTEPPLVALLRDVHAASPSSKSLLLGDEDALAHASLWLLGHLTHGHLMWTDVDADTVSDCLRLILRHNLVVGSMAVLHAYLAMLERRRHPRDNDIVLTSRERAVLRGLMSGRTERHIASAEHMDEATVRRIVAMLGRKFGVDTTYALCAQVGRLGLVTDAS